MKTLFRFFLLTSIVLISVTKGFCDTIDFYHVYYNVFKIREYNYWNLKNPPTIEIKIDSIKNGDEIIVKYFCDMFCNDCKFYIQAKANSNDEILLNNSNIGQFNPLIITLKDLLSFYNRKKEKLFKIYYYEEKIDNSRLLFYIKLIE